MWFGKADATARVVGARKENEILTEKQRPDSTAEMYVTHGQRGLSR